MEEEENTKAKSNSGLRKRGKVYGRENLGAELGEPRVGKFRRNRPEEPLEPTAGAARKHLVL